MLTIEDIRNPKRKSGFNYVATTSPGSNGSRSNPFWAQKMGATGKGMGAGWTGPRRPTAEAAAQDYCDYVNSGGLPQSHAPARRVRRPRFSMGGVKRHAPTTRTPTGAERHIGATDLYDVEFYCHVRGIVLWRKVGVTAAGEERYLRMHRTHGISVRPRRRVRTFATRAEAEAAERKLIARLDKDPKWVATGRESFVPAPDREENA